MSKGVNTYIGVGNMGADPDYGVSATDIEVARVSVAFNDNRGGKENTVWLKCKFFKGAAKIIDQYAKKGTRIYVRGRISIDEWNDKTGALRQMTCVLVDEFVLLDGSRDSDSRGKGNDYADAKAGESKPEPQPGNQFEDDIPF